MKKIIVSMFIVLSGAVFASPAFADEPTPVACAISSDSDVPECSSTSGSSPEDNVATPDVTEEPILTGVTDCAEDMSICERNVIMYNKEANVPAALHQDKNSNETWWNIFTDPNHIAAELGWTIIQDFVVLWLLYGVVFKKCILPKLTNRIHAEIDKEHGIEHE